MTARALLSRLRAFRRREDGTASVEFALMFPVVLSMFFWALELGLIMTKQVILEHAVDVSMRDLRLGKLPDPTPNGLKEDICKQTRLIKDCRDTIMIELQPLNTTTWAVPNVPVTCRDRDEEIAPTTAYNPGADSQIMLVRVCVIVEPYLPGIGIGAMLNLDATGGFGMAAMSAFVNEPS